MKVHSSSVKHTVFVLAVTIGFSQIASAQHDFSRDPMTISAGEGRGSGPSGRDNLGDNKGEKSKAPNPPQETQDQIRERQVREIADRKMKWRTPAEIAHGLLIGQAAQRKNFEDEALREIIERDQKQKEKDREEAERVRQENERIRQENLERRRREGPLNNGGGGGRG